MRKIGIILGLYLLFSTSGLLAQSASFKKYINIHYDGTNFQTVLGLFEQQTGLYFQYNSDIIPTGRPIHIAYKNVQAQQAIKDFLHQYGLDCKRLDNYLVLCLWSPQEPKKQFILSGRVSLESSGERLVKAMIYLPQRNQFALTDEFGIFRLAIPTKKIDIATDTIFIVIQYGGCTPYTDTLINNRDYFLNAQLKPSVERIETTTVIVKNEFQDRSVIQGQSDQFGINSARQKLLPALMGENDILRTLSFNPGVVTGSEGMMGIYVRGGSGDQNLVLLDEAPVFNAYHLYGIFGIFNGDIVKSAQMNRGAFSPEYGGRLSSVISVQSIDGNENTWSSQLGLGLLSTKATVQGPIWRKRTTAVISIRRSNLDFVAEPITKILLKDRSNINTYYFWDINAKINHKFSEKSALSISFYRGGDNASFIENRSSETIENRYFQSREQGNNWGNQVGSIRWRYAFLKHIRFTLKAYVSDYVFAQKNNYQIQVQSRFLSKKTLSDYANYSFRNGLRDIDFSGKTDIQVNKLMAIRFGGGYTKHVFTPGDRSLKTKIDSIGRLYSFNDPIINTPEIGGFVQIEYHSPTFGYLDIGSRIAYFGLGEKQYYLRPEPRLTYRYRIRPNLWVKATASKNIQFFHQLNNLAMGLPSDLWVPSNTKFEPSEARQTSLGFTSSQKNFQISSEVFLKKFYHLLEYKDNAIYINSAVNWEETLTQGTGEAKGWELLIEKTKGKLNGWVSYTLMWNTRQFLDLNNGNPFPSRYDRRHNIYLVGTYLLSKSITISGSWSYNSGFAYTAPEGIYLSPTSHDPYAEIYIYGERNALRSIANHRLDLSFQYRFSNEKLRQELSIGIYNCYNRKNPFFINVGYNKQGARGFYQMSLLPFLPHLNYQIFF